MLNLEQLIAKFEAGKYVDYEIRNMIYAYRDGFLDFDGEQLLIEGLVENLGGGAYLQN